MIACLTGVLVIVSLVGGFVSYLQFQATKASAQAAQTRALAAVNTTRIAEGTLKNNIEASRLDQRAWIGVDNITGIPTKGSLFNITVTIKNTGKTPAKNVHPWKRDEGHLRIPNVKAQCRDGLVSGTLKSTGFLNPGGVFFLTLNPSHGVPLRQELRDVLKPGELLYVYGCITYDDVFDLPHWLTYCSFWDENTQGYDPCEKYNDTGDGSAPK